MANEVLVKMGTPVCWADTTDYSSAGSGITRTHQILLEDVANAAAREGAKADLGATRAAAYAVLVGLEFNVAPTAGTVVDVYWTCSYSGTAATGNTGGATGSDADYPADSSEAEWVKQLIYVGSLVTTADAKGTPQYQCINERFSPPTRYGAPIVFNQSGQALNNDDANEMFVALIPITDEVQ